MHGLLLKRNADEILERRRLFFRRRMQNGILCTFCDIAPEENHEEKWREFDRKWSVRSDATERPFPSNEEVYERMLIGLEWRGTVEDDWLPVLYSSLDLGEGVVAAFMDLPLRFYHRKHYGCYSKGAEWPDYSCLPAARFAAENRLVQRAREINAFFNEKALGRFGQHSMLTMDALNFACELRGATNAYYDIYEHPEELKRLMELALDCNIRFQEMQMREIGGFADGCFVWLGEWAPFPRAIALSVDAYVICSVDAYVKFGFEYQQRLIDHFGHGLMHLHCNRADLAAQVAKLRGLELLQYGGDTRDKLSAYARLSEIRQAAGDIPLQIAIDAGDFRQGLHNRSLPPNTWYAVQDEMFTVDEANALMDQIRKYKV